GEPGRRCGPPRPADTEPHRLRCHRRKASACGRRTLQIPGARCACDHRLNRLRPDEPSPKAMGRPAATHLQQQLWLLRFAAAMVLVQSAKRSVDSTAQQRAMASQLAPERALLMLQTSERVPIAE